MDLENKWNHFADQTGNFYTSIVLLGEPDGVVQLRRACAQPPLRATPLPGLCWSLSNKAGLHVDINSSQQFTYQ